MFRRLKNERAREWEVGADVGFLEGRVSTEATLTVGPTVAGAVYHTVERGETFGSIAASEGTTVAELEALNPGVSSNALSIGQKIRVK